MPAVELDDEDVPPADEETGERTVRLWIILAVAGVVIGAILFAIWRPFASDTDESENIPLANSGSGIGVGDPATAKVKAEIYTDYACVACKDFATTGEPTLFQAAEDGTTFLIVHPTTLTEEKADDSEGKESDWSESAANMAVCASDEGQFQAMHQALFANQPSGGKSNPKDEDLLKLGEQVGIDSQEFTKCVTGGRYDDYVESVTESAISNRITKLPTVFIAGKEQTDLSGAALRKALDDAGAGPGDTPTPPGKD